MSAVLLFVFLVALALLGVWLGRHCARLRKPWWLLGYILPFALFAVNAVLRWMPGIVLEAPLSWFGSGLGKYAWLVFGGCLLLSTLQPKLPREKDRKALYVLMGLILFSGLMPTVIYPSVLHGKHQQLLGKIDADGVCLQSTGYTCGPAAAVTALSKMGVTEKEGALAIDAYSSPMVGTEPDLLCAAVEERHQNDGVQCHYRAFESLDELTGHLPAIALMRWTALMDHYVTVLEVNEHWVTLGDPLDGWNRMSLEEFRQRWRRTAITFSRSSPINPSVP